MNRLTINVIEQILHDRIKDDQFTMLKTLPTPQSLKDIQKATQRIVKAIHNDETINIVGDYDVDGVVATALMVNFFTALEVEINYIIPNRFEHGYGLSPLILEEIYNGIVITVDNGIGAIEAAKICKKRGLDLIITDHHTVGEELPEAFAIVNPKQLDCKFPYKEICGAQVAWYLCASIKNSLNFQYNLLDLFDLLCLAIVADIMPMKSLNKTMVKKGLQSLQTSQRPCIVALRQRYGLIGVTEEDIGFKIAPLINCAGRMSDPSIALEFLLSFDEVEANMQLDYLIELNEMRKQEQLQIFQEAKEQVKQEDKVIVVASEKWNEGIIGIVASKLCEKYKKPSFVLSINEKKAKGSGRSTAGVNLYELIASCDEVLDGFGGHKQAAGLSLQCEKIEQFKKILNQNIQNQPPLDDGGQSDSLGEFCLTQVGENIYNLIESYRPYGITNPYPLFTFSNLEVKSVTSIGKNKEYKKLEVSNGSTTIEVVVFVDFDEVFVGERISFTANIAKNEFRGEIKFNLMLKELLKAD